MNAPITDNDLHAYADGRLDPARAAAVETWLASHPEHRAEIDAWREQSASLHRAYDQVLAEPVPARLLPPPAPSHLSSLRRAAAIGWLALGALAGWLARGPTATPPAEVAATSLPRQAAIAHAVFVPEVRHPVEVGADQEAHLVAWLSKRLGAPLKAPSLVEAGYRLVGGRLLAGESGEVAQFMYEDQAKRRLTLYVRREAPKEAATAFRHAQENGVDVFYWTDSRFGYALSGSIGGDNLLAVATLVYRQLGG